MFEIVRKTCYTNNINTLYEWAVMLTLFIGIRFLVPKSFKEVAVWVALWRQ